MSESNESAERVTWMQACEVISRWMKDAHGLDLTPRQIFEASPSGELFHVPELYRQAKDAGYDAEWVSPKDLGEPTEAELAEMTVEQLNAYADTFDE